MGKSLPVIVGEVFGRLTVLGEAETDHMKFRLRCECGKELTATKGNVRAGKQKSCGCWARDATIARSTTHSMTGHPLYGIWADIKKRCLNPLSPRYSRYGGRGITISNEWLDFPTFVADVGERPGPEYTLDREDNNKGYCKDNCRWATKVEQGLNTMYSLQFNYKGQLYNSVQLTELAAANGVNKGCLRARLAAGVTVEAAVDTPTGLRTSVLPKTPKGFRSDVTRKYPSESSGNIQHGGKSMLIST